MNAYMFEGVRRSQKKTEREEHALDRRAFLKGAASAGALSALPASLRIELANAGSPERINDVKSREHAIEQAITYARAALRTQEAKEALQGKVELPLGVLARLTQLPFHTENVNGTKFDTADVKKHSIQIVKKPNRWEFKSIAESVVAETYGNGFFFESDQIFVTAKHVLSDNPILDFQTADIDIEVRRVNGSSRDHKVEPVLDTPVISNEMINGSYVSVEGVDPDVTSTDRCKSYRGIAVQLNESVAKKLPGNRRLFARSFMVVIPSGESTVVKGTINGKAVQAKLSDGMSGSPVYIHLNGRKFLAGIFYGDAEAIDPITGRTFSVGLFHGIEDVRAAVAAFNEREAKEKTRLTSK